MSLVRLAAEAIDLRHKHLHACERRRGAQRALAALGLRCAVPRGLAIAPPAGLQLKLDCPQC
jgi:hypothetical protein